MSVTFIEMINTVEPNPVTNRPQESGRIDRVAVFRGSLK